MTTAAKKKTPTATIGKSLARAPLKAPPVKAPTRAATPPPAKAPSESAIKAEANAWALLRGWWIIKVDTDTMNGVPDHYYLRRGQHRWVEWKKPITGVLSAQQEQRIEEIIMHGGEVRVFDNMEDFQRWMY